MHILGKTMARHFFGHGGGRRGGDRRGGSRRGGLGPPPPGITSFASLTCLSMIDVKDLLQR
jgi:hypothetical protein